MMGPMGPMGMMGPEGMGMGMGPMGPMGPPVQQKEVITLNSCVLLPPHPGQWACLALLWFLLSYCPMVCVIIL